MYKKEEEPHCLECGERLYGRTDKKFCSCECKSRYHGHLRYIAKKVQDSELNALAKNYSILETILNLTTGRCPLATLEEMGFRKEYVTQVTKKGSTWNTGASTLLTIWGPADYSTSGVSDEETPRLASKSSSEIILQVPFTEAPISTWSLRT